MRLSQHPILGAVHRGERVTITVEGQPIEAFANEPLAVALQAAGIISLRQTSKLAQPRGLYCGEGTCGECRVHVDGQLGLRACVTPVKAGMAVNLSAGELDLTSPTGGKPR